MSTLLRLLKGFVDGIPQSVCSLTVNIDKANTRFEFMEISVSNIVKVINPSCTKVFGTHTFYGGGGGGGRLSRPSLMISKTVDPTNFKLAGHQDYL